MCTKPNHTMTSCFIIVLWDAAPGSPVLSRRWHLPAELQCRLLVAQERRTQTETESSCLSQIHPSPPSQFRSMALSGAPLSQHHYDQNLKGSGETVIEQASERHSRQSAFVDVRELIETNLVRKSMEMPMWMYAFDLELRFCLFFSFSFCSFVWSAARERGELRGNRNKISLCKMCDIGPQLLLIMRIPCFKYASLSYELQRADRASKP
jgi:hypothetical protein